MKKFWVILSLVLVGLVVCFISEIRYGLSLAQGQLNIIFNAKKIEKVLVENKSLTHEQRRKLLLIKDVKAFAVAELGLKDNGNYDNYFDQKGKPLLTVLTACEPYSFKEKTWHFPFLGDLSYKGFFEYADAKEEGIKLKAKGLDVGLGKVSGWSTLGWLKDPVLSSMLNKPDGQLGALIIHEMLHGTVYLGSDVNFSENLADFVGREGAKFYFLKKNLPNDLAEFENEMTAELRMNSYFLKAKDKLEKGYKEYSGDTLKLKKFKTETIKKTYQGIFFMTLPPKIKSKYIRSAKYLYFEGNDYLMGYNRYGKLQDKFEVEFKTRFNSDIRKMIEFYKEH